MSRLWTVILFALIGSYCLMGILDSVDIADRYVEYQIKNNQYAVIYVEVERTSPEEAKRLAMERAAKVTKDNGYRYFTVDSEKNVTVVQSNGGVKPQVPGNLYQELIVEQDFTKPQYQAQPQEPSEMYPGLKLLISCYKEKPGSEAVDACSLVSCP